MVSSVVANNIDVTVTFDIVITNDDNTSTTTSMVVGKLYNITYLPTGATETVTVEGKLESPVYDSNVTYVSCTPTFPYQTIIEGNSIKSWIQPSITGIALDTSTAYAASKLIIPIDDIRAASAVV